MDKPLDLDSYESDNIEQLIQYGLDITKNPDYIPKFTKLIAELVDQLAAVRKWKKCNAKEDLTSPQDLAIESEIIEL